MIIDYASIHTNLTHQELASFFSKQFGVLIARRTIGDILHNKYQNIKDFVDNKDNTARIKKPVFEELDIKMVVWLRNSLDRDFIITEDILKLKAREVAATLGIAKFVASNGWLHRFKTRNNIKLRVLSGETCGICIDKYEEVIENIKNEFKEYEPKNIFNMDESGLNFRDIPSKTLSTKPKKGFKKIKERITLMFCVNSDGSEKEKLTIIGKSKKPRCFQGFETSTVCNYISSKKAWLTSFDFKNWLHAFNLKMQKQNRKIVLLIDNAPSHKIISEFSNIKILFLPPNTTGF
ncbi:MAG: transposase [Fusobacteriaceae bacterium]